MKSLSSTGLVLLLPLSYILLGNAERRQKNYYVRRQKGTVNKYYVVHGGDGKQLSKDGGRESTCNVGRGLER